MDCRSASAADCVRDCGEGVQWPNERKPIFFIQDKSTVLVRPVLHFPGKQEPVQSRLVKPSAFSGIYSFRLISTRKHALHTQFLSSNALWRADCCDQREVREALVTSSKGDGQHRVLRRQRRLQSCNTWIPMQPLQQLCKSRIHHLPNRLPPNPLQQTGGNLLPIRNERPHPR